MCNDIVRYYLMSGIGILSIVDPPSLCTHSTRYLWKWIWLERLSGRWSHTSLAGQTLMWGGQILIIVSCLKISWPVSDKWRCKVAFFGMLLGERVVKVSPTFS